MINHTAYLEVVLVLDVRGDDAGKRAGLDDRVGMRNGVREGSHDLLGPIGHTWEDGSDDVVPHLQIFSPRIPWTIIDIQNDQYAPE